MTAISVCSCNSTAPLVGNHQSTSSAYSLQTSSVESAGSLPRIGSSQRMERANGDGSSTTANASLFSNVVFSVDGHRALVTLMDTGISIKYSSAINCCLKKNSIEVIPFSEILSAEVLKTPDSGLVSWHFSNVSFSFLPLKSEYYIYIKITVGQIN